MNLSKKIYYNLSSVLPLKLLRRIAPVSTLFPYHHTVSNDELLHIKHLYSYKSINQFKNDLDYLLKLYRPVTVEEVYDAIISGKQFPQNAFLLSFDDGFKEIYEIIAPILSEKGVPAIFFVNPAFLDNQELFYRCKVSLIIDCLFRKKDDLFVLKHCSKIVGEQEYSSLGKLISEVKKINNLNQFLLDKLALELCFSFDSYLKSERPFLSTKQVKELSEKGFCIGSHSWNHPYYNLLNLEEQQNQTLQSSFFVKETFKSPINCFSFPFSDKELSQTFFDHINKKPNLIDLFFGTQNNRPEIQNRMIHRFNAERPDMVLSKQVKGLLLMLCIQKILNNNIIKR